MLTYRQDGEGGDAKMFILYSRHEIAGMDDETLAEEIRGLPEWDGDLLTELIRRAARHKPELGTMLDEYEQEHRDYGWSRWTLDGIAEDAADVLGVSIW